MINFDYLRSQRWALALHMPSLRIAAPAVHASWQAATEKALVNLPKAAPRWQSGALILTSPRSGKTYTATTTACTCKGCAHSYLPRPCWPRAAAYLVRSYFDALRPLGCCRVCQGPMVEAKTYAGDRCAACVVCGHEVEWPLVLDLVSWQTLADEAKRRAA